MVDGVVVGFESYENNSDTELTNSAAVAVAMNY